MNSKEIPMVPNRKASLPRVYGDTPSFLGVPVIDARNLPAGCDVIVAGVPWEGTVTWGSFSSCELAPRSIRHASARYGGFLPEYEIDLFDHLQLGDMGDIPVNPNDPAETMANVHKAMLEVYRSQSIPFVLGGDHSFTPEIVRALGEAGEGEIGVIHFDAHLDNAKSFGADMFPRCGPLHRIVQLPRVRKESIVHLGIRGPRNSPAQYEYARSMGARIFTTKEIRERGMVAVTEEAIAIAHQKTKHVFVTICSDCIDAGYNPGGPADFNGLLPTELLPALQTIGCSGIDGLDFVEVYPGQDPQGYSSHLAAWAMIYALSGVAQRKRDQG
ncbi:agmatinase family protein [Geomonas sp. Red69]|uniref:agmatinase family protein n=1 Tax=Geomonas diazotrophica TaxID=2843197 RepID=UPI001C120087|nr:MULTISPECIES: agmatinase family protein [Geomonas]MBU5635766.1 agmatinase family protein [Geomonas diazotrophica]QXE87129.1 agmatinase family protein [Geomonas nitrogeniifigens]